MQFWKMNGAGNDFIILNNLEERLPPSAFPLLARTLCTPHRSLGADGLMVVEQAQEGADFKMLFFNSDGSLGEMCGNGARCICRYGYERGLAGPIQRVETTAGLIVGTRLGPDSYRVQLNLPSVLESQRVTSLGPAGYVELGQPGVPHAILRVPGLEERSLEELRSMGQTLRHDHAFPKGANANLYDVLSQDHLVIRTFERGVEDFTYACGTGTGSLVALLTALGQTSGHGVRVENLGGQLIVDAEQTDGQISALLLTGPATLVCQGHVPDEALPEESTK